MSFVFSYDFNGQVRTPELAQLAADTIFRPGRDNLVLVIEFENRFWAEVHANSTPLAPLPVDEVFL
jgi:hypothetical protein